MKEEKLDLFIEKIEPYLILIIISSFVGVVSGVLGALFLKTIDIFIEIRNTCKYIIFLLPVIGMIIVFLEKEYKLDKKNTRLVSDAIKKGKSIPNYTIPALYVKTTLSQFAGASVGRMEAPIKMGGALGNYISDFFNLKKKDRKTVIASGISGLFGSILGLPFTGIIFAYEMSYEKNNKYPIYIMPIVLASAFARFICFAFKANSFSDRIIFLHHAKYELKQIILILLLIVLCSIFMLIFNKTIKQTKNIFLKIKNEYIRVIIGSILIILAIYLIKNDLFCGNNPDLLKKALQDNSMWYIFVLKTILTAICLAVGFKGGEIGPAIISGGAFGILLASLMGLDPLIGAAIGIVCLFGGVTGTMISPVAIGIEIFGFKSLIFFIIIAIIIKYLIDKNEIEKEY